MTERLHDQFAFDAREGEDQFDARVGSLEGKLRSAFQDTGIRADGLNQVTLSGAKGAVLSNLADGRIAAGSRDAVTGSQLHDAKQEIARNRSDRRR